MPRWIPVFVGFVQQPNGNTAIDRVDGHIGVPCIGNPIHDDVDLLSFLIEILVRAIEEILAVVKAGWKIQFRINRRRWILARQRSDDICVIGVIDGIGPEIVVLGLEALEQRRIARKINRLVDVVGVWRRWDKETRRRNLRR